MSGYNKSERKDQIFAQAMADLEVHGVHNFLVKMMMADYGGYRGEQAADVVLSSRILSFERIAEHAPEHWVEVSRWNTSPSNPSNGALRIAYRIA